MSKVIRSFFSAFEDTSEDGSRWFFVAYAEGTREPMFWRFTDSFEEGRDFVERVSPGAEQRPDAFAEGFLYADRFHGSARKQAFTASEQKAAAELREQETPARPTLRLVTPEDLEDAPDWEPPPEAGRW